MISCEITNPTKALRRVYDGMGGKTPIDIEAGQTKRGVILAEHTVALLRQKAAADDPQNPMALRIREIEHVGEPWDPPDPRKAEGDPAELIAQKVFAKLREELRAPATPVPAPAPASKK